MKRLHLAEVSEQLVANAVDAFATTLRTAMAEGQRRGFRSQEYERLLLLITGDSQCKGIAQHLVAPAPIKPGWEPIVETPPNDHAAERGDTPV